MDHWRRRAYAWRSLPASGIPRRNTCYRSDRPPRSRATDDVSTAMKPNESIMTFDSRSAAFQPVDLVVNQAGVPDRTAFMRGTSTAPQQRCWPLLPGFCSPRSQQGLTRRRGPRGLPSEPAWTVARVQQSGSHQTLRSNFRYRGRRPASGRSLRAQRVETDAAKREFGSDRTPELHPHRMRPRGHGITASTG
jgi:hypothetical protein